MQFCMALETFRFYVFVKNFKRRRKTDSLENIVEGWKWRRDNQKKIICIL
jgi:hypothetical protein